MHTCCCKLWEPGPGLWCSIHLWMCCIVHKEEHLNLDVFRHNSLATPEYPKMNGSLAPPPASSPISIAGAAKKLGLLAQVCICHVYWSGGNSNSYFPCISTHRSVLSFQAIWRILWKRSMLYWTQGGPALIPTNIVKELVIRAENSLSRMHLKSDTPKLYLFRIFE